MSVNLLSMVQQAMGSNFAGMASRFLGESETSTQSALGALLPAVLGGIAQKGSTPDGAASLLALLNRSNVDNASFGSIGQMLSGNTGALSDLVRTGSSLAPDILGGGDKTGNLISTLSSMAGIKSSSATSLLGLIVPAIFALLKKYIGEKGLSAGGLASLLAGQGDFLKGALDSRITSALGFASPGAFLGSLGGAASDAARRTGAAVASGATAASQAAAATATASKSAFARWLPWIIGAAILLFLWNMFAGRTTAPPPAPAPAATAPATPAPAPAPAPAATTTALPADVFFEIGQATIGPDGQKVIEAAAAVIKRDNLKVSLTGHTDRSGDAAQNEELAKNRAAAVRDALKAAGVAESNMEMKAPMFVEAGAGTNDPKARRVEINK